MSLTDVLTARLRATRPPRGRPPTEAAVQARAAQLATAIEQLVTALVTPQDQRAVLARPLLVERWPLRARGVPEVWPREIAMEDVARALTRTGDAAACQVAAALLAPPDHPSAPPAARARWDPVGCAVVLLAAQQVRADARRRCIALPTTHGARATLALVSQGRSTHWDTATTVVATKIELTWDSAPRPYQLVLDMHQRGFDTALVPAILDALHADGLRDYLLLHRMAAEHGRSGGFPWRWRDHKARTAYARRIAQGNVTEAQARHAVTTRLWQLKGAEVRQTAVRPDGQQGWVRIGPFGLLDIPAAIQRGASLEAAQIQLNPALYAGAHKDSAAPHFTLLPDEALLLEGPLLRLAVLLTMDMRYARDAGGTLVRSAAWLWDALHTLGGRPARKYWPRATAILHRALDRLAARGVLGHWTHEAGPPTPQTTYSLHPAAWWRDQLVHQARPELPPPRSAHPATGTALRAWRTARGWTQHQAAQRLGVGIATLQRAEYAGVQPLGPALTAALAAYKPPRPDA
jgi:hypothetical protein